MEMIGGSSVLYLACALCVPLFSTLFNRGGETEGLLDYQGRAGDHFHCAVEPSPGHIRCRTLSFLLFFKEIQKKQQKTDFTWFCGVRTHKVLFHFAFGDRPRSGGFAKLIVLRRDQ